MKRESRERGLKWALSITPQRQDDALVLRLSGRVSSASAEALRQALNDAISRGDRRLVVDFGLADYISSAGLGELEAANSRLDGLGGALVLCALPEPVRLVLDLAGLLPQFRVETSVERAVARAVAGTRPP